MIKGSRLTLRAITPDDLPRYVSWLNDLEVSRHLGYIPPFNLDDETDWYNRQRQDEKTIHLAIDTSEKIHIGTVSLMNIDHRIRKAELGIVIGLKSDWGKGYGTEAVNLMLAYGFKSLNLNRIYLYVDTDNAGAITCYQRCGFTQEGELRQEAFRDGAYGNVYIMSILRSEYNHKLT